MANKLPTYIVNRILDASESPQEADNTAVTGWDTADEFIVAFQVDATTPWGPEDYKIQWRDDDDGVPTWTDLASSGAELIQGTSTTLVNGNGSTQACTSVPGGSTWEAGVEVEGAAATGNFTHTDEYYTEFHFAIDPAGATAGHTYAFRLYAVTSDTEEGVGVATVTMASASPQSITMTSAISVTSSIQAPTLAKTNQYIYTVGSIDIGSPAAIDRSGSANLLTGTYVDKNNPANANGTITDVEVFLNNVSGTLDVWVGTFSAVGNVLTCRDSESLGNLPAGFSHVSGLSITVQAGDYIGIHCKSGTTVNIDYSAGAVGGDWMWSYTGECIDPTDSQTFSPAGLRFMSLKGIGWSSSGAITVDTRVQPPTLARTNQYILPSPIQVASSVVSPTLSGTDTATITMTSAISVAATVNEPTSLTKGSSPQSITMTGAISVTSSVVSPSLSGTDTATITMGSAISVASSVVAPELEHTDQYILPSPIQVTSSVVTPSLSGTDTATITMTGAISVAATVNEPTSLTNGSAPQSITMTGAISVTSSVVAPTLSGTDTATITLTSAISVVSSVVAPSLALVAVAPAFQQDAFQNDAFQVLFAPPEILLLSPITMVSSVVAPSLTGTGSADITPTPIQVTASVTTPTISGTGSADIASTPIAVASSVVTPVLAGTGNASITVSPIAVGSAVQSPALSGSGTATITMASAIAVASSVVEPYRLAKEDSTRRITGISERTIKTGTSSWRTIKSMGGERQ